MDGTIQLAMRTVNSMVSDALNIHSLMACVNERIKKLEDENERLRELLKQKESE